MARLIPSALISGISGSIAGTTFQKNISGLICRAKPKCRASGSQSQNNIKRINSVIRSSWSNFSPALLERWQNFTLFLNPPQKNNKSLLISSFNLFYQINFFRLYYNFSILTEPFFTDFAPEPVICDIKKDESGILLKCSRSLIAADEFIILHITETLTNSRNNFNNKLRLIPFETIDGDEQPFESAFIDVFGQGTSLEKYYGFRYSVMSKVSGLHNPFIDFKQMLLPL